MFNRVRIFWIAFSVIALALSAPAQDVTLDSDTPVFVQIFGIK